jgi:hypothetical protein
MGDAAPKIQTAFRFPPELLVKMKRKAKSKNLSLNAYAEEIFKRDTRLDWPVLPADFKISEEIRSMHCIHFTEPTAEELAADPKLAYLWEKYGKG